MHLPLPLVLVWSQLISVLFSLISISPMPPSPGLAVGPFKPLAFQAFVSSLGNDTGPYSSPLGFNSTYWVSLTIWLQT